MTVRGITVSRQVPLQLMTQKNQSLSLPNLLYRIIRKTVTPALSLAQQIIRAVLRNRVHKIMHLPLSLRLRLRPTVMLP